MRYRPEFRVAEDPDVYPPSEDSILLIESLEVHPGERVLEIGCGSGIVSMHCAAEGCEVVAGDINPKAVDLARRNLADNNLPADVKETDVYSAIEGRFDTIVFNLPYLPVDEEGLLAKAWSGGPDGLGPLPELLRGAPEHLNEGGRVVIVVSSLMDQSSLGDVLEGHDIRILGKTKLFFEELSVVEIRNLRKGKHQNEIVARE
ncbi:MAG: methyltransferase [Candidatus Methanomethylophilaceae archaeon]|nr:methyltransferase [Candidatus Methanomethylophilaceae archaeon]